MKKNVVLTGLLAAMMFFTTAYVLHIPIVGGGYIHLGDTILYIAATLLPTPYAMAVGVIGGGLADVMVGAAAWAPSTVIIKAVMALAFTAKKERMLCSRNLLAPVWSGLICIGGYFVAEVIMLCLSGSGFLAAQTAALAAVPFNGVQALASGVAFILLAVAMDRLSVKQRLERLFK